MNSSSVYPEAFAEKVKNRFPQNVDLHEALDWGRFTVVSNHFQRLLNSLNETIEVVDQNLSNNCDLPLDDEEALGLKRLASKRESQRAWLEALKEEHDLIEDEIRARTALFPLADLVPPPAANAASNDPWSRVTVPSRSMFEH